MLVSRDSRGLDDACLAQLVPPLHHLIEGLLLPRLDVSLVLLADGSVSGVVPESEEVGLGVEPAIWNRLVRCSPWISLASREDPRGRL